MFENVENVENVENDENDEYLSISDDELIKHFNDNPELLQNEFIKEIYLSLMVKNIVLLKIL